MKFKTQFFTFEIDMILLIIVLVYMLSKKAALFLSPFFMCYLFILFHELSHLLIAAIFNKKINKLKLSLAGVCVGFEKESIIKKTKTKLNKIKDIIVYMAGPVSNIILAIIFFRSKQIFEINIFLAMVNILPLYPLDGYNIVSTILSIIYTNDIKKTKKINLIINKLVYYFVFFIGIAQISISFNPSILIFLFYIFIIKKQEGNANEIYENINKIVENC
ncbi:MAG: hypothetical protein RSA08_04420 [Clostridia bacterium]